MSVITGRNMLLALPLVLALTLLTAPTGKAQDQTVRLSIVVDKSCLIQPESDPLLLGDHANTFRDAAICQLESVLSSHPIEEKITAGERSRFFFGWPNRNTACKILGIRPRSSPSGTRFRQHWRIDSDPQPASALFPGRKRIVLSLKDVHYIDSSGIGVLVSVHMAAGKAKSVLELTHLQPRIRDLFELTG
jgi:hypothetical protein